MRQNIRSLSGLAAGVILLLQTAAATVVPQLTFEQLTATSELVVTGAVTRSWAEWDAAHKYIWTHYELAVASAHKGVPGRTVEFAEPGGQVNGSIMTIGGTVGYAVGEHVAVFLSRMPNGYLRTTGWAQGKYSVDPSGRLTGSGMHGLNGLSVAEFGAKVAAQVRPAQATGRSK